MIIPNKLKKGDEVRIISPSRSLSIISNEQIEIAKNRFEEMGLCVSFGKNVKECDDTFNSSSIESRVEDIHDAFLDENVKAIFTAIGGFNSNQLLQYIDYNLIYKNPKILCGYSDITALQNAILAKTGLITYSGPHFSTFGMLKGIDYTKKNLKNCLFQSEPFKINPSTQWSDDAWYLDQENRDFISNSGFKVLNNGFAKGHIVGGNLCTLNLLQGSEYMPSLKNSILLLEDDDFAGEFTHLEIDRNLQSLIHLPDFCHVKAIVFGRFQKSCNMSDRVLSEIISSKKELADIPVISGLDFGHTTPHITFPIGGMAQLSAINGSVEFEILQF